MKTKTNYDEDMEIWERSGINFHQNYHMYVLAYLL